MMAENSGLLEKTDKFASVSFSGALTGDSSRDDVFDELLKKIAEFQLLPDGWDTYGGKPAGLRAVLYGRELVRSIREQSFLPVPTVAPISTGVFIELQYKGLRLYFEADETSVLLYCSQDGEEKINSEDRTYSSDRATDAIRRFASLMASMES